MRVFVGIDPGKEGGIVLLKENRVIDFMGKMPVMGEKKQYDIPLMNRLVLDFKRKGDLYVTVEKLHALPRSMGGSAANFQRGYGLALWEGILSGHGVSYQLVMPQRWQKVMLADMPLGDQTKVSSLIVAKRTWPVAEWSMGSRMRKEDSNLSDAALLALYGLKTAGAPVQEESEPAEAMPA